MTTQALEQFENMNAQALAAVEGGNWLSNVGRWAYNNPGEAALVTSWLISPATGIIGTGVYNGYHSTR
ncbi:ComC/BlpC family leader-containing pheromone/bacteriocin [Streptococcus orisasini]|uniref:ComC/BlpC family leader-containing pheromone/bacteriocin n=1 Tax=Streptococcus orisasini TaxID=1080071 RepID=UPI00070E032C|nr:ComC/BlpC family leader-containing pheromone/bacteriocin [Streptococcus orisasini]